MFLKDLFRRIRLFASLNRLFFKIFLWFWGTIWGLLLLIVASSYLTGIRELTQPNMFATVAPILAADAVNAFEAGGAQGFGRFASYNVNDSKRQLFLLDSSYHDVLGRPISADGLRVARSTKIGHLMLLRNHIAGYRTVSASGKEYVSLLYLNSGFREARDLVFRRGTLFLLFLLSLITLLCVWLAWHITAPIYAIQSAARRVSLGDLQARAPTAITRRHDELASLAQDFNAMVQRIEILVTSHQRLLAAVSHELRSPLTRLNLSVAMLHKSVLDQRGADLLHRMDRDVTAIDRLMGQLLTLSRFEAGISAEHRSNIDLSDLVHQVCADGAFEADALGKKVSASIQEGIHLIGADPFALSGAFENIVRNAIRFTAPATTVDVCLSITAQAQSEIALLTVRDRGPGVADDLLQTIFKPFFRTPDNLDSSGNGLGLAIALEAIQLHQGKIVASNRPGGGLEMRVDLPLVAKSAPPPPTLRTREDPVTARSSSEVKQ